MASIHFKTGGIGVAGRPLGGDGDGLNGTGIPIIGARPGIFYCSPENI